MTRLYPTAVFVAFSTFVVALAAANDSQNPVKIKIAPGGLVNIVNNSGSVTLHPGSGQQVVVNATRHSDKLEVDSNGMPDGRRVEIRTHVISQQKLSADESKVEYDITVPPGVAVTVSTATAPITVENLNSDLSLSSDTGRITIKNVANAHIHVRSIAAPIALTDIANGYVDVTSNSSPVQLENVSGPRVVVGATSGDISYRGDCSGGGIYNLTTHSGTIDVALPQNASVDLTARSLTGSVENDFPLQQKPHSTFVPSTGRSLVGTSNSGSSSMELQSFNGRIRVKRQ
ncbi:MAG TPA: DUF4097 family beta strand repeat-containing protein [Candidatus Angelobacter sp.]|jgi:DUF4097 and DUF4098 domain-containing protein YvlB|nr:DUF4097 family beta strand repeat-containing protein [Candidatus Angelobacter sp.]